MGLTLLHHAGGFFALPRADTSRGHGRRNACALTDLGQRDFRISWTKSGKALPDTKDRVRRLVMRMGRTEHAWYLFVEYDPPANTDGICPSREPYEESCK